MMHKALACEFMVFRKGLNIPSVACTIVYRFLSYYKIQLRTNSRWDKMPRMCLWDHSVSVLLTSSSEGLPWTHALTYLDIAWVNFTNNPSSIHLFFPSSHPLTLPLCCLCLALIHFFRCSFVLCALVLSPGFLLKYNLDVFASAANILKCNLVHTSLVVPHLQAELMTRYSQTELLPRITKDGSGLPWQQEEQHTHRRGTNLINSPHLDKAKGLWGK